MPNDEPILAVSEKDSWVVQPDDPIYSAVAALPRDGNGAVRVEQSLLASVQGWWYDKAWARVEEYLESLGVPWDKLEVKEEEIQEAEAAELSERLANVSFYRVKVSRELARVGAKLMLTKAALDHAVSKQIAVGGDEGTIKTKSALIISKDRRLRATKIEVMEGEALKCALEGWEKSLEIIWSTVSRVLSVRLREPVE